MKKLQIILIAGVICLFLFSVQNKLSAQSPESSCEVISSDLEEYEVWEENTVDDCWRCELDTEPEPVYDQWGNYIGLLYNSIRVNVPQPEVVCHLTGNPEHFCHQISVTTTSNDECHPLFVPDGE